MICKNCIHNFVCHIRRHIDDWEGDCPYFKHKERFVKLPDKVYDIRLSKTGMKVDEHEVKGIIYDCGHMAFDSRAIGKSVFLTKAEATQALKERQADNG